MIDSELKVGQAPGSGCGCARSGSAGPHSHARPHNAPPRTPGRGGFRNQSINRDSMEGSYCDGTSNASTQLGMELPSVILRLLGRAPTRILEYESTVSTDKAIEEDLSQR